MVMNLCCNTPANFKTEEERWWSNCADIIIIKIQFFATVK